MAREDSRLALVQPGSPGIAGIRRLILASGSPRRRQLLPLLGLPFVIKRVSVDERPLVAEPPTELVLRVSQLKALAVPVLSAAEGNGVRPDELVVAADTIVVLDGEVLGKPAGQADAAHMLSGLRNRPHVVYSGISVYLPAMQRMETELGQSSVWMRDYTDEELARYVASGDPLDKAGAYAIQHPEFDPVSRVEGCWLSVMGLPLCHLGRALAKFGVVVPANVAGACQAFSQRECDVFPEILMIER
jgi:septum formation protein